jgi:hypothetical protein
MRLIRITALLWLALISAANAQGYTQSQLDTLINTLLPTNGKQQITALDLRNVLTPMTAAIFQSIQVVTPQQYGAKCDGVTDDTVALQAWALGVVAGGTYYIAGNCLFSAPLIFATAHHVSIFGDGYGGTLTYAGGATTGNIITIGTPNDASANYCSITGWTLQNVRFMSNTVMTAGVGVIINDPCEMHIIGITVGGNLGGNANWYNGIQFNGGNSIHMVGYNFSGSHIGEIINGDPAAGSVDMYQVEGKITSSAIGLNIAGNVGGFNTNQTDYINNGTNVLVDQSQTAVANAQLTFGSSAQIDLTSGGAGIGFNLNDPGSSNSILILDNAWLASATNQCLVAQSGVQWLVNISGGLIYNCGSDGIKNLSLNTVFNISGTYVHNNGGWGINDAVANPNITIHSADFGGNVSGDTNFTPKTSTPSVLGQSHIPFILISSATIGNNGALTAATALPVTYPSAYAYFPAGAIAASGAGSAAGWYYMVFSSATAGTIYNNTYTSGTPTIPASPTAFVTTGPGGFTQTTGSFITGYSLTIPGYTIGPNGSVRAMQTYSFYGSTNNKIVKNAYSNYTVFSFTNATMADAGGAFLAGFSNRQATNIQVNSFGNNGGAIGLGAGAPTIGAINSTANQSYTVQMELATGTDYIVNESIVVEYLPGVP